MIFSGRVHSREKQMVYWGFSSYLWVHIKVTLEIGYINISLGVCSLIANLLPFQFPHVHAVTDINCFPVLGCTEWVNPWASCFKYMYISEDLCCGNNDNFAVLLPMLQVHEMMVINVSTLQRALHVRDKKKCHATLSQSIQYTNNKKCISCHALR